MKDEFNRKKEFEYNRKIKEFKRFDAIEYYKPKEIAPLPPEIKKFKEGFNDKPVEEKKVIKNRFDEKLEQKNQNNQSENTNADAQNGEAEGANMNGGAIDSSASTTASTASSASSTSTVVTASTSLAGGVSIISACAIVAATVGSTVMNAAPKVEFLEVEAGSDYLQYKIDVLELTEDTLYKVKVYNDTFNQEYEIHEEGIQKQIVTGLIPNRRYTISVVASNDDLGDITYYTLDCYTSKLECPRAVFDINPTVSIDDGSFNLDYNVFISDYYQTGYQTYLEIYIDEELSETNRLLDEENYFRGYFNDLYEGQNIYFAAYTTYYDELTKIGEFGYKLTYPDYMADEIYKSTFDFKAPVVTTSEDSYFISIDTGFIPENENEGYIIDVYKTGEYDSILTNYKLNTLEDDLVLSFEGRDQVASFNVPANLYGIDIYLTPTKEAANQKRFYAKRHIGSYSFSEYRALAKDPTASITFNPVLDYDNNIYNLDYDIKINDPYNIGEEFYYKVLLNNNDYRNEGITSHNVESTIENLYNGFTAAIIVYSKRNGEEIIIGSDEFNVEYPIGFGSFTSKYSLDSQNVSLDLCKNILTVDTKFEQANSLESYTLNVYDSDMNLLTSKDSIEAIITFEDIETKELILEFVPMANGKSFDAVSINYTQEDLTFGHDYQISYEWNSDNTKVTATAKKKNNPEHIIVEEAIPSAIIKKEATELEAGLILYEATFQNSLFTLQAREVEDPFRMVNFDLFENELSLSISLVDGYNEDSYTYSVNFIYNDEKERNLNGEFSGFLEEVFDLDYDSNTYSASDISSITLSIFDIDGNLVRTYKYSSDDANITYSAHQIDENAIITIPYEIEIKDATFDNAMVVFDRGTNETFNDLPMKNSIRVENLTSNELIYNTTIYYKKGTLHISREMKKEAISLETEVSLDYYASYVDSEYCAFVEIDAYIDDVKITRELELMVLTEGMLDYDTDKILDYKYIISTKDDDESDKVDYIKGYYKIPIIHTNEINYLDLRIDSLGYKETINIPNPTFNKISAYDDVDNYSIPEDNYYIVTEDDGMKYYYFNFDLESTTTKGEIVCTINYSYKENGITKYGHTKYFTSKDYILTVPYDLEDINLTIYYKALDKYIGVQGENNPSPANYNLYEKGDGSYKEASSSFIDGITYYQSEGNDYIIVNPQILGLYELDVDQSLDSDYYKLSTDTAFDSNKQYYVFEEEKYILVSPSSLGLMVKEDYILTEDTYFDSKKEYFQYIDGSYILATPKSLNFKERISKGLVTAKEEEFQETDYYIYDNLSYTYNLVTPTSLDLYVNDNENYEKSTDTSFMPGVSYYKLVDGEYVFVNPLSLNLYKYSYNEALTEDNEFIYSYFDRKVYPISIDDKLKAISNDMLYYNLEDDTTIIRFNVDTNKVTGDSISLSFNQEDVEIPIYDYQYCASKYEDQGGYYTYDITIDNKIITVAAFYSEEAITYYEIIITFEGNLVDGNYLKPIVTYSYFPNDFVNQFDEIVNSTSLIDTVSYTIADSNITYSSHYVYDNVGQNGYTLTVRYEEFHSENDTDTIFIEVYSDSAYQNLITSKGPDYSYYKEANIEIPNEYSIVYIKTKFIRSYDGFELVLYEEILGKHILNAASIEDVGINSDGVFFRGEVHSENLSYRITKEYENGSKENEDGTFDSNSFDIYTGTEEDIIKYTFEIIDTNTNEVLASKSYIDFITVSDYTYDDLNDYISFDYEISTLDDLTIESIEINYGKNVIETSELSGTLNESTLSGAYEEFSFIVSCRDKDDKVVTYRVEVTKELEITDIDYEYEILGITNSSYSFTNYSGVYDKINDVLYDRVYIEGNEKIYKDANGNLAPTVDDEDVIYISLKHTAIYETVGEVIAYVGPIKISYKDYEIEVTKGGSGMNNHEPLENNPRTILGSEFDNELIFLHSNASYTEDQYKNREYTTSMELEFSISYQGKSKDYSMSFDKAYENPYNYNNQFFDSENQEYTIERLEGDKINLSITPGFKIDEYPNYAYKITLYSIDSIDTTGEALYTSDLITGSEYTFTGISDKAYKVSIIVYEIKDNLRIYYDYYAYNLSKPANTAVLEGYISRNYNTNQYYVSYILDEAYVDKNQDINIRFMDTDHTISLEDGEYDLNGYTANVTSSNGRITVDVTEESPSSRDTFVGSITLDEGNSEIGYSTKTYYIS